MIKVSIIVPVYKVDESKLRKCIESLINQTYEECEIILVDDGSEDNSSKICDEYSDKVKQIKTIHQENKGLSGARNTGVKNSSGDWYIFVDGDDYLDVNAIELLVSEVEDDIDVISSRLLPASQNEDIGTYPYVDKKVYSSTEELYYLKRMLINFNGNNNSSCGKLYSKEFTDKYHLFHNEFLKQGAEDLEFNFRVFSKAQKIKILCNGFYHCVYNEKSITRSFNENNEKLKLLCFKNIRRYIDENDKVLLDEYYNRLIYVIVNSAISGFFNPNSNLKIIEKRRLFEEFIKDEELKYAMDNIKKSNIDKKRLLIIYLIKAKMYLCINFLAKIRYNQKKTTKKVGGLCFHI